MSSTRNPPSSTPRSPGAPSPERLDVAGVTPEGAAWLASAGTYPRSTLALWRERPNAPLVLPCGSAFDVVSAPALFGRRMLDRLWDDGPGSGPVAVYRGRMLMFAAPGTAQRLPSLMKWEEWGSGASVEPEAVVGHGGPVGREAPGQGGHVGRCREVPPLLCHGTGDAVTVPALGAGDGGAEGFRADSRWLVAPDTRQPWLPGPEILLWAAVRAARAAASAAVRISIFPRADQDAKVYDVSRRR
ncbi:bifunctional DNA primase/polymerase [Streptomyces sp. NPDC091209]|uniref:bifunctional DNA primase/polymerase n=1 Tax=Streptomyces sp. NPDC091209 TaxID=3365974 RepID=UPI003813FB24